MGSTNSMEEKTSGGSLNMIAALIGVILEARRSQELCLNILLGVLCHAFFRFFLTCSSFARACAEYDRDQVLSSFFCGSRAALFFPASDFVVSTLGSDLDPEYSVNGRQRDASSVFNPPGCTGLNGNVR